MRINKKLFINISLLAILLLAAFLRLYHIRDYLTFLGDEGRDVLVVMHMIVDHKFTLLGPTASVGGFFLGPIYYYFMVPFLWLFRLDPVGPAVMVALFGIATVFLVYKVGNDLFSQKTGLFAAFLYAISPLVVSYSRSSWNPNLMPFFSLLIIYVSWKIVSKGEWRLTFWLGLLFGIFFQLHYLASFLAVTIIIYLVLFGRLKKLKEYALGILGFLAGFSPFLLFEVRHGFPNITSLIKFLFAGKEVSASGGSFFSIVGDVSFRLFDHLVTNKISRNIFPVTASLSVGKFPVFSLLLLIVSLLTFFYLWRFERKNRESQKTYLLIFLWGFVGTILFGFYKKGIYDYYFGFLFPLPFLLVGFLLSFLSQKKIGTIVAGGLLLILAWLNIQGIPFRYQPNKQLDQTITISRFVVDKTGGKPFNFALITGQNSDHAYRYFFEIWGHKPITIEYSGVDPRRKTVTDQLLVICEKTDCAPLGNSLWEIAGFGRAEIAGSWDVSVVKVYRLVPYKGN